MTIKQYKQIQKIIDKLENQVLKEGDDITSDAFKSAVKLLLSQRGFTLEEYEEAEKREDEKKSIVMNKAEVFEGEKGEKGESIQGEKGGKGGKGEKGEKGQQGERGESIQGEKGEQGQQGIQGIKGEKGETAEFKGEIKQFKEEMIEYVNKMAVPRGSGSNTGKGSRFFNWGMPDKGSYGTAIPDDRYALKGEGATFVDDEVPAGTKDGSNLTFTLAYTPISGSLKLFLGGAKLEITNDYSVSGKTITMVFAPESGETLLADYRR